MKIKLRLSELPEGSCFLKGRGKTVHKKSRNGRTVSVGKGGRIRARAERRDPFVRPLSSCPLNLIGVDMVKHPESVIEIGDGRPRKVVLVNLRAKRRR